MLETIQPPSVSPAPARFYDATYLEALLPSRFSRLENWIIVAVIAGGLTLGAYLRLREMALLGTFAVLALCIALVPLTMRGVFSILDGWMHRIPNFLKHAHDTRECHSWSRTEFLAYSASTSQWQFGLATALLALLAYWRTGAFAKLPPAITVLCVIIAFIAAFACGVGICSMFWLARYVWRVGKKYDVRVTDHGYGVLSTGRMLLKCYSLVALVWAACTMTATWKFSDQWILLLVLAVPSMAFFVSSFVVCQFPLHLRMVDDKRDKLMELDRLLNELAPSSTSEMTPERQNQLQFCVSEINRVSRLPEWPFSVGALSGVAGAAVGTVAPTLLKALLPSILGLPAGA